MNENELNKLENHIDDPIKKCVAGMALLGFVPIFSCCGFRYKGERIRKDHFLNKPYIYIDHTKLNEKLKSLLLDICIKSKWKIDLAGGNCIDFHGHNWNKEHPWSAEGCLHKPELNVISLRELERVLEGYKEKFQEKISIRDGNDIWKKDFDLKYWQYEPAENWEVTPEIFSKL